MTTVSRKLLRREGGYEVWRELNRLDFDVEIMDDAGDPEGSDEFAEQLQDASGRLVTMDVAYTPSGSYIGDVKTAQFLCAKKGIIPEVLPYHKVCSIGFCEREQKWYGWSHRAMYGFGVGNIAKEGDCVCSSGWTDEYLAENPEADMRLPIGFEAKTLDDAKRMATAFAESVG